MPTLNPDHTARDPSIEPTTDEFGTNVGEKILERTDFLVAETAPQERRCNLGLTEQKIRLGAGAALVAAALFAPVSRGWRIGFAAFGATQLITGAMRFCPLWQALGIDTRRESER